MRTVSVKVASGADFTSEISTAMSLAGAPLACTVSKATPLAPFSDGSAKNCTAFGVSSRCAPGGITRAT